MNYHIRRACRAIRHKAKTDNTERRRRIAIQRAAHLRSEYFRRVAQRASDEAFDARNQMDRALREQAIAEADAFKARRYRDQQAVAILYAEHDVRMGGPDFLIQVSLHAEPIRRLIADCSLTSREPLVISASEMARRTMSEVLPALRGFFQKLFDHDYPGANR